MLTLKQFGNKLRQVMSRDEAYAPVGYEIEDWDEGGCGIVAKALVPILKKLFGGPVELIALTGRQTTEWARAEGLDPEEDRGVGHVFASVGGILFDSLGAHTRYEILRQAKRDGYDDPRLVTFESMRLPDEPEGFESEIWCPNDLIAAVRRYLSKNLGV